MKQLLVIDYRSILSYLIVVILFISGFDDVKAINPKVDYLRTNYMVNPLGIDNTEPKFSWIMTDDDRGEMQSAYQIIVASTEENIIANNGDVWSTGKVTSDASIAIKYEGPALESFSRYYWKVKIWDKDGHESSWSEPAWWEMGLLNNEDWNNAKWITHSTGPNKIPNYSIDVDFTIVSNAMGVIFGAKDISNFFMWQVYYDTENSTINFKPHTKTSGNWNVLDDFSITTFLPYDERNNQHHLKIEVNGSEIKTYINDQLVDTRSDTTFKYGNFGFRVDENNSEDAMFDNLIIKNTDNDSILYSNDFSQNPSLDFPECTIEEGQLHVVPEIQLAQLNDIPNLKYIVDVDFKISEVAAGFVFGAYNVNNLLMWQVNYNESTSSVNFRPHSKTSGTWNLLDNIDISSIIPYSERFAEHHMKIEVKGNEIKTWLNDVAVDTRIVSGFDYGLFGFRENASGPYEEAYFDNLLVKDSTGNILYSNNFDESVSVDFPKCSIVDGKLKTTPEIQLQENVLPNREVSAPLFRKQFTTNSKIKRARVYATARGLYDIYINGNRISEDALNPGSTDYNTRIQYQTFDVTEYLVEGENVVGSTLGEGWYSGNLGMFGPDQYGNVLSFIGMLRIEYENGSTQLIVSDESWKSTYGPVLYNDLLNGEIYDARLEIPDWNKALFDDTEWNNASLADDYNGMLVAQIGPTVQKTQTMIPQSVFSPKAGVYIYDMGQNMVGWAKLKVSGNSGDKVVLRFGEMLNDDSTLYTANLRTAKATDIYFLKGEGTEEFEPRFTFHGFRYVEVTGFPGEPGIDAITCYVLGSATTPTGSFECSNPKINQLYSNITWGQRGNFLSIPTDCPQRDERLGWTGDAQIFARTATYNMDVQQFFTKWMNDVVDVQAQSGSFSFTAPFSIGDYSAAWSDVGIIIPWTIYKVYGDKSIIEDNYSAMQKYITFLNGHATNYIMPAEGFGDWLNVNSETPKDVLATAFYAYSVSLMAKMAAVIGNETDAESYNNLFEKIKDAYINSYMYSTARIKGNTQTAYLVSLYFNLLPDESRAEAAKYLVENIEAHDWHLTTGFIGISYLNPILTQMGYNNVAYRLLNTETYPSWIYPINNGATTIWERWNSYTKESGFGDVGMNSFNHYSFGSVGEWMFRYMLGIDTDEEHPAFKKIIMNPSPDSTINYAKGEYQSVYGNIKSSWKKEEDNYIFEVTIPANSTANITLPAYAPNDITEGDIPVTENIDITVLSDDSATVTLEIGAGSYVFKTSDSVTNIPKKFNMDTFKIYPNPSNDYINIEASIDLQNAFIQIINTNGMIVYERRASSEVNISGLTTGIYYLIINKEQTKLCASFIKY